MSENPPSDERADTNSVQNERRNKRGGILGPVLGGLAAAFLKYADAEREKAAKEERQRADEHLIAAATKSMARYTGLLALVTAASVFTAGLSVLILREQLNETKAEQRPNLWFGSSLGAPQFVMTDPIHKMGQIVWSVHLTNLGKNFIIRGNRRMYLRLGNEPLTRSYKEPDYSPLGVIAPNQDIFITAISKPGYSLDYFTKLATADFGVVVKIETEYTDFTGTPYAADMCLENLRTGAINFCKTGNEIK